MSINLFASAIGTICGRYRGLFRLVLPRSLPRSFKNDVGKALEAASGIPVLVGDGEYSAGEAIAFRTPEDGAVNRAIVLITSDGQTGELKSLETFRDLLANGMPGGTLARSPAILTLDDIALEVAKQTAGRAGEPFDVGQLSASLSYVLIYLAAAYEEAGNDEKRWTDAYWQHADMLVERLPWAIRRLPSGAPGFERDVVFASAGLPRPVGPKSYAERNDATKYASIVAKSWSSQQEIARSLVEIDLVDTGGAGTHPLSSLEWQEFPSTRANLGHPLLAAAYHGADRDDGYCWLHGWASTSEKAFFEARVSDPPEYELGSLAENGEFAVLSALGWQGLDHILPPGPKGLRKVGSVFLGSFRLRLAVDIDVNSQPDPVLLEVRPRSSCTPKVISYQTGAGYLTVDFELSRRAGKTGGKWREKPFVLSVSPSRIVPGSSFRDGLTLRLCAPHPARPTAIAVEQVRGRETFIPSFATDGKYVINGESDEIDVDRDNDDVALLKLREGLPSAKLAVVGECETASWADGQGLLLQDAENLHPVVQFCSLTMMPDNSIVNLDGYQVELQAPQADRGQVNPVFASILGEPVMPPDDDLHDELLSDPRGLLEDWYQQNCISARSSLELKSSLGACVLEANGQGTARLSWNPAIGTFTDIEVPVHLDFPEELAKSQEAVAFWEAFEDLDLRSYGGVHEVSVWPSALDLRSMPSSLVERYLSTYCDMLNNVGEPRVHSWLAYPFSVLLYNQGAGEPDGVLLSPLHPLRFAWAWSVQQACDEVAQSEIYGQVASSFLRFIDGELLPLAGPATRGSDRWVSTGLAPGPRELFVGWTMLAKASLRERRFGKGIQLMGRVLPFGTPSGLDQGGVTAALRDYMRVYPASPQLRIGLTAPRGGERYVETDEAVIAASGDLIDHYGDSLPGGVRIFDSTERRGRPPSPVGVLRRILPEGMDSKDPAACPPFEWTTEGNAQSASKVDLQFIEDTVVRVRAEEISEGTNAVGTAGPAVPFSRYRSWHLDQYEEEESSFALGLGEDSFGKLPTFAHALGQIEKLKISGHGLKLTAALMLGDALLGGHARWTITGNRHLNPSGLSSQLHSASGPITLWEWRPAFLSRQRQRGAIASVASTHPYTVLAKPSGALTDEVTSVLTSCGMASTEDDVHKVITSLGTRGVGLSSLLTMGHTQSLGAIGFSLAFKALETWEAHPDGPEVRSILPMDAVYPLLDVLGEGARITDDRRRADLLLINARLTTEGTCSLHLHPVEVKMRSSEAGSFPQRSSTVLSDPLDQLASTHRVLKRLCENHESGGKDLSLANAALATLVEAAFSLRPPRSVRQVPLETKLLGVIASGKVVPSASSGTLLWFQANATGIGGGPYELRPPDSREPGQVFVNPASLDGPLTRDEIGKALMSMIERGRPANYLANTTPQDGDSREKPKRFARQSPRQEVGTVESATTNSRRPKEHGLRDPESGHPDLDPVKITASEKIPQSEGITILTGTTPAGATTHPVYFKPSDTTLNQLNIGVVGDLGTGKTQFLKSLVYQLSRSAQFNRGHVPKVFIFDYKRDYSEGDFPNALGAKILDPSKQPLPINFFALGVDPDNRMATQMERVRRANFFCDLLRRISGIGPVQRNDLYTSVMSAYEACAQGHAPSINDVFSVYTSLGKKDSVVSVLTLIRDLMIFESDPQNTTTFRELFDRCTVLNLSALSAAGQDIVDIIATMFLDHLYTDYMKTLPKEPFIDAADGVSLRKIDSFVLIDEAHHAMGRDFDVLMKLMLEGREFGMGVVLSSQFLSHFDAGKHDWGEALSTWVVHNVRNATAKQFERIGFRGDLAQMAQDITGLKTHWAYYRCVNGQNEGICLKGQPFYSLPRD